MAARSQLDALQAGAPPALSAMAVDVVPSAPYDLTYNGGAMLLGSSLGWALGQAMTKTLRALQRGENVGATMQELFALMTLSHTELCRTDRLAIPVLERVFPAWRQWLDHPTNDDWWDSVDLNDRPAIPTLQTTGWWDLFLGGSLQEFAREPRHAKSRLVIGPWSHMVKGAAHGSVFYGMGASFMNTDVTGQQLDFLGRYLFDGRPEPEGPPVRIFVMGANTWRDEDAWPLARATNVQFFLHDGGRLSTDAPVTDAAPASFEFDPLDPVPTVGGRNLLPGSEGTHMTGPCDHSVLDIRHDILRFVSDPLDADMEVTGHVSVTLHAATSAADTDWSAMLLDVWPDGRAFNVADGYLRARHRNGNDRAAPINAGEPTRYEIDLVATSQVFKSGHRLRVDISSSNFPRYDRNPGTGALSSEVSESEFVSAHQTVFVDATRASFITLPIVP